MEDLTQRQIDILKAIIQEYTESAEAVGSEILEKKYKLGVSPATIRNEMVALAKKGYLKKSHFSSGRLPFGGTKASGSFKPAGLFSPYYCTYPVAILKDARPLGKRSLPV